MHGDRVAMFTFVLFQQDFVPLCEKLEANKSKSIKNSIKVSYIERVQGGEKCSHYF